MFTFIWADGQASAVESLKTQNSNMYLELGASVTDETHSTPLGVSGTARVMQGKMVGFLVFSLQR